MWLCSDCSRGGKNLLVVAVEAAATAVEATGVQWFIGFYMTKAVLVSEAIMGFFLVLFLHMHS